MYCNMVNIKFSLIPVIDDDGKQDEQDREDADDLMAEDRLAFN